MLIKHVALVTILTLMLSACNAAKATTKPESKSASNPKTTVYYAGFGYLGSAKNNRVKFPHAVRINQQTENKVAKLTSELTKQLEATELDNINVRLSNVDQNEQRPLMMAFAVEREGLSYNAVNEPRARVLGQVLFFDFNTRTLLSSFGIMVVADQDDIDRQPRGNSNKNALFDHAYLSKKEGINAELLELLKSHRIHDTGGIRYQVSKVHISDAFSKALPEDLNLQTTKEFVGQVASKEFSQGKLNMLPYNRGQTIGRQMAFRLTDASGFNLQLPKPDYEWHLQLIEAKMLAVPERRIRMYRVKMQMKLVNTLTKDVVLDIPIRRANTVPIIKGVTPIDTWSAYEDAIRVAIRNFANQLNKPEDKWCKGRSNGRQACQQLRKLSETIFKYN